MVSRSSKGVQATATSHFTTRSAGDSTLRIADVTPNSGETTGVGMPIIVDFNRAVTNRSAVERALQVQSDKPVTGAWLWTSGSEVIFRPQSYWPAHQNVRLVAHLTGVRAAGGIYGVRDYTQSFKIGAEQISKVDLRKDVERWYIDGKKARTISVSGGVGGTNSFGNNFTTTSGVHLVMGKWSSIWMTSPNIKEGQPGYYHEQVFDDVRISNSGEFLHRSPGAFGCLGNSNCSHGCVRQTVAGAAWVYNVAQRGDVVIITGTNRPLEWQNGWGYWQKSWKSWQAGSTTGPVTTAQLTGPAASAGDVPSAAPSQSPSTSG